MVNISYNKDYFDVIKEITTIQIAVKFVKNGDNIIVQMANDNKSMAYRLEAPSSYFGFDGNEINIRNFPEFYQLLNLYDSASIHQSNNNIVISNNNSKINYVLSNSAIMPKSPVSLNKKQPDVTFILNIEDLKELYKMNSAIKSEFINIKYQNKNIHIKLFNSAHDNSFEKSFTPLNIHPLDGQTDVEEFDYVTRSEIICKMPDICDYVVSLTKTGQIFLEWKNDGLNFLAISGKIRQIEMPKQ